MQSIRSRIILWLLRNRHLLKLKLKPEVVDENFSVPGFREEVDRATAKMKMPDAVTGEQTEIAGMKAEWIVPDGAVDKRILLYIHGGGFISGSCTTHRMHVAKFAKQARMRSLVFDYRLAPEHPYPAALDDCVSLYGALMEQGYDTEDIVVGGESAGGTLTLSLLLALKERNMKLPRAAFSISPVTDLRCRADSFRRNAAKDIAPMGSWDAWTLMYIADNDASRAPLSPLMGDFRDMPPILICVGSHEIHLDDCRNMAEKIRRDGSEVILSEWPGMVHAFPVLAPLFPEAQQALEEICGFVAGPRRIARMR